ncbi:MAG: OS_HP3 family (seleno)protein, partial [Desulfobacterales bacterium]
VTIQPRHISLRGYVGDPVKSSVMITLEEKYPFKILNARASKGKYISFQLEEIKKSQTTAYELTVENRKQDVGRYYDSIVLETDSEIRPQLDIRVYGFLRARKTD